MKILKIILCFFVIVSFSCNDLVKKVEDENENRISAKLVNNPITAEKGKKTGPHPAISFDKLAITTGARVRKLSIEGSQLPGVFHLRENSFSFFSSIRSFETLSGFGKR